jgi:putative membrane protein
MKNLFYISITVIMCNGTLTGCKNNEGDKNELGSIKERTELHESQEVTEEGKRFIHTAANFQLFEMELSKYAESRSTSPEIKEFAKRINEIQSQKNKELQVLADKTALSISYDEGMAAVTTLKSNWSGKSEGDFDREFLEQVMMDYHNALLAFNKTSMECEDVEIKAYATNAIPDLKNHMEDATKLEEKLSPRPSSTAKVTNTKK